MESGPELQGSPPTGDRPKGELDSELVRSGRVSMGPTSKAPLTQHGSEGQGPASMSHSTPSSAVELDILTTGSEYRADTRSPEYADLRREYRPPEDLTREGPSQARMRSAGGVEAMGQAFPPQTSSAGMAPMENIVGGNRARQYGQTGQQAGHACYF